MNNKFINSDFKNGTTYLKAFINNVISYALENGKYELPYAVNLEFIIGILKLNFPTYDILVSDNSVTIKNIRIRLCDHDTIFIRI